LWLQVMTKEERAHIKDLAKCDFSLMTVWLCGDLMAKQLTMPDVLRSKVGGEEECHQGGQGGKHVAATCTAVTLHQARKAAEKLIVEKHGYAMLDGHRCV
jgi:hypothetical protein